jgi:glycosyltransferase involved in cell wall biosynthesis
MELRKHSLIIFCKTLVKGGAEKQALLLARLLSERGLNVVVISWRRKKIDAANLDLIKASSLTYYGLTGGVLHKFIQFNRILKEENASVVLAYLTLANCVSGISKWLNRDLVTIGGIRTEKLPQFKLLAERFVHNRLNNATIFNNYSAKERFEKLGFDTGKIDVIHNAIKVKAPVLSKIKEEEVTIITVARFVESKDFETAILAFRRLRDISNQGVRYYIVGYGSMERRIRSLIKRFELDDEINLIINPPDISALLQKADIYLSTSLYEGLSNSIMEAMVAKLPLVVTDVGDNKYLVREGSNGYLVPAKATEQIALKLGELVNSERLRMTYGEHSLDIISNHFSEEKLLSRYKELINLFSKDLQFSD